MLNKEESQHSHFRWYIGDLSPRNMSNWPTGWTFIIMAKILVTCAPILSLALLSLCPVKHVFYANHLQNGLFGTFSRVPEYDKLCMSAYIILPYMWHTHCVLCALHINIYVCLYTHIPIHLLLSYISWPTHTFVYDLYYSLSLVNFRLGLKLVLKD